MVTCLICKKDFRRISNTHLKKDSVKSGLAFDNGLHGDLNSRKPSILKQDFIESYKVDKSRNGKNEKLDLFHSVKEQNH